MTTLRDLFARNPEIAKLAGRLVQDDVLLTELAHLIEQDAILTRDVLRIMNSAAYGRANSLNSVKTAIAMLGTEQLRQIVVASGRQTV